MPDKQIVQFTAASSVEDTYNILMQKGGIGTSFVYAPLSDVLNAEFPVTFSTVDATDQITGKYLRASHGAVTVSGAFSATTAPFYVNGSLVRAGSGSEPTGRRIINRIAASPDTAAPIASANQAPSVTLLDMTQVLGNKGGAVADSWDGSRTTLRITISDANAPAYSLSPTLGSVLPSTTALWTTQNMSHNYGGVAAETGYSVGSHFLTYGNINLRAGATNLTNVRFREFGLYIESGASTRVAFGTAYNVIAIDGAIPSESLIAIRSQRGGRSAPGWRALIGQGGQGYSGVDPISGRLVSFEGSRSDPIPKALGGVNLRDVEFSGSAIAWPHGEIIGGEHDDLDAGSIRVGTGYFKRTATGASIDAKGFQGNDPGHVFDTGVDLIDADPVVPVLNNMLGDDEYGGTYRFFGIVGNEFQHAEVINPPVASADPGAPIEVRLRHASTGKVEFVQTGIATTTSHPTPLTATADDHYVGRYLAYYTGAAAGERRLITDYVASTGVLTTSAFSTVPTAEVNVVANDKFQLPLPTVQDTITNSWQFTKNGGTGTLVRTTSPNRAVLTGDGTNYLSLDQAITLPDDTDCRIYVSASGGYRIKVGTTRGDDDLLFVDVVPTPDENGEYGTVPVDYPFHMSGTTAHIRIENKELVPATLRSVRCADDVAGLSLQLGVRAGVEAAPMTVDHTWTKKDTLDLQPSGGTTKVGGAMDLTGNLSVNTSKFTVTASSGNVVAAGTLGVAGDFAVNTSKFTVAATTGNTAIAGTLNVSGATTLAALGATTFTASGTAAVTGDFSVNTSKFTVAAATGNTAVAGTFNVTGATVLAGLGVTTFTASSTAAVTGDFSVNTSKFTVAAATGNVVAAGTMNVTGAATAASFIPSSSTVPTNGLYLPAANTLGLAINSAAEVQLTATALSPAVSGGNNLGTTALPWGSLQIVSGGTAVFGNDVTVTHSTDLLTISGGGILVTQNGAIGAPAGVFVQTSGTSAIAPALRAQGRRGDANGSPVFGGMVLLESVRTDALPETGKTMGGVLFGGNPDLVGGIGYSASITGTTSGAWVDATNAPIDIVFRTGVTASILDANINYGTDRGRVTSGGRWLLGSSTDDGSTAVQANGTFKATGAATFSSTATAASFIPSSSTVPTNGLYLPAANTLGLAINSAAEVQLTATALSPAVSGGNNLGTTALPWGSLQIVSGGTAVFGNDVTVTHSTDLLTISGGGILVTQNGAIGAPAGVFVQTSGTSAIAPALRAQGRRGDANGSPVFGGMVLLESVRTDALPETGKTMGGVLFGGNPDLVGGIGYSASITGTTSGAWVDATNAPIDIVFRTGVTASILDANINYGTDRGRVTSGGRWLLGSSTDDGSTAVQANGTFKATGAATFSSTATAASFIPSSSTVPTNGLYLPAANTLGLAINSAAEVQLTATALSPAVSGGNNLGTTDLPWGSLQIVSGGTAVFGNDVTVTHSTDLLTISGGGLSVTSASLIGTNATAPNTVTGGMLHLYAADGTQTGMAVEAWAAEPRIVVRRANNTAASPTAIASGDNMGVIEFRGHDGTAATAARANIRAVAAETYTTIAHGTHIDFGTTKIGSVNAASARMRLHANGSLLIGTTTEDGSGNALQVTGAAKMTTTVEAGTTVKAGTYFLASAAADLTAAGTNRATSLQLAAEDNYISTAASGTGVSMPVSQIGMSVFVSNDGANAIKVYALASDTLDGVAGSTGVTLSAGSAAVFKVSKAATWRSRLLGGVAA